MFELILPSLVLSIRSYMMKALADQYDSTQYLFIYSIILLVATWIIIYKRKEPYTSFAFLNSMSGSHIFVICLSVIATMYMARMSFDVMKSNTVVKYKSVIRGLNLVFLMIIGKFYFNEKFTQGQFTGFILIVLGTMMMAS